MNIIKFAAIAAAAAEFSKDPSTQVGAVVVDDDGHVLSVGYNGFPRGVDDDPARYADREQKLKLIAHAESNAIAQAARCGVRLAGASLIVTALYPCSTCAKLIIQAGIKRVYAPRMDPKKSLEWFIEAQTSGLLFKEAGVQVIEYRATRSANAVA